LAQVIPLITLYGIKNCTSVQKARQWLTLNAMHYTFHDFRVQGLTPSLLDDWLRALGWEPLLNRRGSTWRQLPEALKVDVNAAAARALMLDHPSLIKRPVVALDGAYLVGFADATYRQFFSVMGR
jgi:arsenate reductase (glutaredoxin)